jgi:hypothetical protein
LGGIIIEHALQTIGNYFFPLVLSSYLVYRIDKIFTEIVENQKIFQTVVISEIKDIKKDIYEIRIDMAKSNCTPGL